jgi:spore maturation protein SpmA
MLNYIWAWMLMASLLVAGILGRIGGEAGVVQQALDYANKAVMNIALPMAGITMFWLGVMRLMEKAGILATVVKFLTPVLRRLFPDVPKDHPALGAIVMNWSCNALGLGNSSTPIGIKAMNHLQELNPAKSQASNAMATFLALNTGAFTLIPMTVINYMNAAGVKNAYQIIVPTILSTLCATCAAVLASKFFQRLPMFATQPEVVEEIETKGNEEPVKEGMSNKWMAILLILGALMLVTLHFEVSSPEVRAEALQKAGVTELLEAAEARQAAAAAGKAAVQVVQEETQPAWRRVMNGVSGLAIPVVLLLTVSLAMARGVKVYEEFVEGAKEGFAVVTRIMPFLVTMFAAIAVFRASGALLLIEHAASPLLAMLGFPVDLLPLAILRPLSGSGASGFLNELLTRPDVTEQIKFTAGILYGSTETTFYVIAVYFGAVGIRKVRHALAAGLTADLAGMFAAVMFGKLLFS